jgi:hypothetical protein
VSVLRTSASPVLTLTACRVSFLLLNAGGHTNTERGYLSVLASKLRVELGADEPGLEVCVSEQDRHPLVLVQGD